jgi:acyl carrier protein
MFVAQFQVDRNGIRPDARLVEDLKGDELDFVEMILRVEEGFDITIPDADASKLTRVRDFYDYVEKRLR